MKIIEFLRGDTFFRRFDANYTLKKGDKLHVAVMKNAYSNEYLHEQIIEIQSETNYFNLEILPGETSKFPIGKLLLEIELTTTDSIVQTNQYELNVKVDGIHGRN